MEPNKIVIPGPPITVLRGETLSFRSQIVLNEDGTIDHARCIAVEIVGKPETRRIYGYDDK